MHAVVVASSTAGEAVETDGPADRELLARVARRSMDAYRSLIDADGAWTWYTQATPIEQISRLPIASRPVSRKAANEVDFESLRAIPWVFSWTQSRYSVPGWFGTGRGRGEEIDAGHLDGLQRLYREWPFFRSTVDNVQREMSRARLEIAELYGDLGKNEEADVSFHRVIADDFARAERAILAITGQQVLLEKHAVMRELIELRNRYSDVLSLLQLELLRRRRAVTDEAAVEPLRQALFLSVNGIAAAMQGTG